MIGGMMQFPLLTSDLIKSAVIRTPQQQIVSRLADGSIHRYTYAESYQRMQQLAHALVQLGVKSQDCVATLAVNHFRHFELYYAISGMGAIIHTLNARLFSEQLAYIINHAEDMFIFVDIAFVPLLESIQTQLTTVKGIVINCAVDEMPATSLSNVQCYEVLIANQPGDFEWPRLPANAPCALCYTSGTTGNPKGVLYEHHSTVMHAILSGGAQFLDFNEWSVAMVVVPMYHVVAWGVPFSAPLYGAKLVLPGGQLDGQSLYELIDSERVNKAYGVPTVWLSLHNYLEESQRQVDSLKLVGVGGAASPRALVKIYAERYDVYWMGLWGMTETSPLASAAIPTPTMDSMDREARYDLQATAGRPILGVEMEIYDEAGQPLPHDGHSRGQLKIRGPWVLDAYFKGEGSDKFDNGWFDTGDVATIDAQNYVKIVDRSKDVIKSGGEWISSVELENAALNYEAVNEACVIGAIHPKWDERPLMFVTVKPGCHYDEAALRDELTKHVAKWWLPDMVIVMESLPHTGTGKLTKVELRKQYQHYLVEHQIAD